MEEKEKLLEELEDIENKLLALASLASGKSEEDIKEEIENSKKEYRERAKSEFVKKMKDNIENKKLTNDNVDCLIVVENTLVNDEILAKVKITGSKMSLLYAVNILFKNFIEQGLFENYDDIARFVEICKRSA